MKLILTSDFLDTDPAAMVAALQRAHAAPRMAWIPSHTDPAGEAFATARAQLQRFGFGEVECLDIDEDCDPVQLAYLHEFDIIVLSDGDPVRFRYNAIRNGLSGRLRQCAGAGSTIVGVGGGALLLTPNVSVLRLEHEPLHAVLASRGRFDGLGAVPYEVLPHANRRTPEFLALVREYSAHVDHEIVALADGAALFHTGAGDPAAVGPVTRYRKGQIIES